MDCVAAPVCMYLVMENLKAKRPGLCVIVLDVDESPRQHYHIEATKFKVNNDGAFETTAPVSATRMGAGVEFEDSILDMFNVDASPTDSFEDMMLKFSNDAKNAMEVRVAILSKNILAALEEIDSSATEQVRPPKVILECKTDPCCLVIANIYCWQTPPFYSICNH